jgi:hypothetical protein
MEMYRAHRVLRADRSGSSWPVTVETDAGVFYTKLRGAAQGPASLVAEIVVGALADALGLSVPTRVLIDMPPGIPIDDPHQELAQLLRVSIGRNLGFQRGSIASSSSGIRRVPLEAAYEPSPVCVCWCGWLASACSRQLHMQLRRPG